MSPVERADRTAEWLLVGAAACIIYVLLALLFKPPPDRDPAPPQRLDVPTVQLGPRSLP